jgi:hypothetical protein
MACPSWLSLARTAVRRTVPGARAGACGRVRPRLTDRPAVAQSWPKRRRRAPCCRGKCRSRSCPEYRRLQAIVVERRRSSPASPRLPKPKVAGSRPVVRFPRKARSGGFFLSPGHPPPVVLAAWVPPLGTAPSGRQRLHLSPHGRAVLALAASLAGQLMLGVDALGGHERRPHPRVRVLDGVGPDRAGLEAPGAAPGSAERAASGSCSRAARGSGSRQASASVERLDQGGEDVAREGALVSGFHPRDLRTSAWRSSWRGGSTPCARLPRAE